MERCSYGFYTKRSEILDNIQKKKDQEKDQPQSPSFQQQQINKPTDKGLHTSDGQNINVPVTQHVPAQQLLSSTHGSGQPLQSKEESKDKSIKVANSTTITLIENGGINEDKDKDNNYPKNYFTLEPKIDKKEDGTKNSITITRTVAKQSPGNGQIDKSKGPPKSAKRPLQYLETLAEKAGITFEDKYEAANTLLALDKQNNSFRRPELKQPKPEPENHSPGDEYRYRNQKEEDDKLQIQQQIIQQQQQQQLQQLHQQQQLQQLQQQQLQQLQQQALQRQHQQALQQHIKNQQDHQELLQKQFQHQQQQPQQSKSDLQQVSQQPELQQQKFLQLVEGPTQVVQQQMSMAQHEPTQQHHQTVTVVSSMPTSMAQHQVQQQQTTGGIQQQAGTAISTMPPLQSLPPNAQHPQQISAEWGHSRVQVIQQPLQNSTYLQQLYNAQGPLLMPGNIALHPGINSQQIQVIAAGKPFQGNQLAPHMLTTQGKQVLQGQAAPFPGYTTIPAIPTTQNQTFVFSPLGVINSQPSILPAHSQPTVSGIGQQSKSTDMHKVMSGGKVTGTKIVGAGGAGGAQALPVQAQCVQVSQPVLSAQQPAQAQIISPLQTGGQTMQFAPWQIAGALPQVWTGGLQAGTLPAGGLLAPNPIFIRGTQPDATQSMFIQHSPQNSVQHTTASIACATPTTAKPRASSESISKTSRPLSNILPSGGIRPASSVSTQTSANQAQSQAKHRGKPAVRAATPASKQDAANQTNKMQHQIQQPKQQLLVMNSTGQMTQLTGIPDKQPKNIQQQALLQQQALQQQQQQQLLHQQQQQTQMVQHYQQQGMTLGMQPATLPVGSVAQALPMTGIPQTISMVQQIHPLGGLAQPGTLVGQISTTQPPQNASLTQVQTLQPQPQTLVSSGLVQTSVGMAVQQQHLNHNAIHTVTANSLTSPQLTLQAAQGTVGLIAAPVQGSMLPLQTSTTTLVTHVKTEDDKSLLMPPPPAPVQQIAPQQPQVSEAGPEPAAPTSIVSAPSVTTATAVGTAAATTTAASTTTTTTTAAAAAAAATASAAATTTTTTTTAATTANASVSTSTTTSVSTVSSEKSKVSPSKPERVKTSAKSEPLAAPASSSAAPVASSAQHTTPHAPQVVTTVASSTSSSTMTSSVTAPVTSGAGAAAAAAAPLFKNSQCTSRHIGQSVAHDKGLPKAMVKPNILTHVIEGYVIQEAGEPFAVNRPLREWGLTVDKDQDKENKLPSTDEPPRKKQMLDSSSLPRISSSGESGASAARNTLKTEAAAVAAAAAAAAAATVAASATGAASTTSPAGAASSLGAGAAALPPGAVTDAMSVRISAVSKWTVAEVCEFIRNIPGCAGYADDFLMQEVDGEALLLIRPEHLVMALSMKLGPALKIVACIDALRPESEQTPHDHD